jgi:heme/copper-type cytochrome/quinol oxidase subunit 2
LSLSPRRKKTVHGAGGFSYSRTFRAVVCSVALSVNPIDAQSPTNIFAPAATPAHSIFDLSMLVLGVTLVIFLVVAGCFCMR